MRPPNFGVFADRILQLSNETFGPLYYHVLKPYWHDGRFMAKMSRNYASTNWQKDIYEVYIPTRDDPAMNLDYYRIVIKVVPDVDVESAHTECMIQQAPQQTPMGIVDSELIVIVAPHLKRRGFIRGWKHIKMKPGYLTAVVVSKIPEICFKRILTLIANFLQKRIAKLLEKLGPFQPWEYDYKELQQLYYSQRSIIERFSYSIGLTLKCFSHVLAWVRGKLKSVLHEIGLQNMAIQALRPLEQLSRKDQISVLEKIKAILMLPSTSKGNFGQAAPNAAETAMGFDGLRILEALAAATPLDSLPDRAKVEWGKG